MVFSEDKATFLSLLYFKVLNIVILTKKVCSINTTERSNMEVTRKTKGKLLSNINT